MSDHVERLQTALADRYRLEREIGSGGMATVFLAEDLKHRRQVAVKVLQPEMAAVLGGERFVREIEIAAGLRHPHILPLHDSGFADGVLYYVMPFVEGESLRDRLKREKQLAIDEAVDITREVADALAYAHARGVVHRDIKPANIMLEAGHAVVTDFGVALLVQNVDSERLTGTGLSLGTAQYMSPEQAAGERQIDGRSDVYSLGCVLYEMLGGDPPFTGSTAQAIVARKMVEPVPSLRVVRERVPEALERVAMKALERTPADRFRTAAQFATAVAETSLEQDDRASLARDAHPSPQTTEPHRVPSPDRKPSISRMVGLTVMYALVAGLCLTAVGFLSTTNFDLKLQIPAEYTPSRADYPIVGARAVIPSVIFAFVGLAAFVFLRYALRVSTGAMRRVPKVDSTLDRWKRRSSASWQQLWQPVKPANIAEGYFIGAIVVSVVVLGLFWRLISAVTWATDPEVLSCSFRPLHYSYTIVMTILITGTALVWRGVFRYLKGRPVRGGTFAVARWGGLAWIGILVMVMALPQSLLWNNDRERALLDGERVYILMETDDDLVIYDPTRGAATQYRTGEVPTLERLNTAGYLFEGQDECTSGS
jgi:serine/threonine protein kinase